MINRLTPEQVSKSWSIVKHSIENSLPPTVHDSDDKMNRILSAALSGKLDVWASYDKSEGTLKLNAIIVTKILYDDASNTHSLLIYCIYGYRNISKEFWAEGAAAIAKYAKSKNCSRIVAYTEYDYLVKMAEKFGGEGVYKFISVPVDKIVQILNGLKE